MRTQDLPNEQLIELQISVGGIKTTVIGRINNQIEDREDCEDEYVSVGAIYLPCGVQIFHPENNDRYIIHIDVPAKTLYAQKAVGMESGKALN